jgi:hypothetical protein
MRAPAGAVGDARGVRAEEPHVDGAHRSAAALEMVRRREEPTERRAPADVDAEMHGKERVACAIERDALREPAGQDPGPQLVEGPVAIEQPELALVDAPDLQAAELARRRVAAQAPGQAARGVWHIGGEKLGAARHDRPDALAGDRRAVPVGNGWADRQQARRRPRRDGEGERRGDRDQGRARAGASPARCVGAAAVRLPRRRRHQLALERVERGLNHRWPPSARSSARAVHG